MDEVSTIIFSLGNSSYFLPTERLVGLEAILRPITSTPAATSSDSIQYLLQENNHPPAYFALAHFWMDWVPNDEGVASLVGARVFSVLLGSLAIPLIFWVANTAFQSSTAGLISAAFMAVSPYSVFLSQEARHYGLAITLITLSLGCFVTAARDVLQQKPPGWWVCIGWIAANGFAFANHYFSALTFAAQGIFLGAIAWQQAQKYEPGVLWKSHWRRIGVVALSTLISVMAWLPILLNFYGSPQSSFLRNRGSLLSWVNPIAHTLAATIVSLVTPANFFAKHPFSIGFIGFSIVLTLIFVARWIPIFINGLKQLVQEPEGRIGTNIIGGFWIIMLGIFGLICYAYGADITRGLRYKFSYYPAIMVMVGGILAMYWPQRSPAGSLSIALPFSRYRLSGRQIVQVTWIVSLLSSLLVVNNFAFPKFYAPDRFIPFVQAHSTHLIVFATTEKIAEQPTVIGAKFLSIGWEIARRYPPENPASGWQAEPQFLALKEGYGIETPVEQRFSEIVSQIPHPVDLWFVRPDVRDDDPLLTTMPATCRLAAQAPHGNKGAYAYIHYVCMPQP